MHVACTCATQIRPPGHCAHTTCASCIVHAHVHVQQACARWEAPHTCTRGRKPPAAPAAPRLCGRWTDGPQLVFGALLESCFDDVGPTEAEAERLRRFRSNMHLQPSNAAAPGLAAPTDLDADD